MDEIDQLNVIYQQIIKPSNLLRLDEVDSWLEGHPEKDIQAFISAAIKWEDYEYAGIALKKLQN